MSNGIKTIGWRAFSDCKSLIGVEIPDSVTNLGTSVFWGCSKLSSVELPNNISTLPGWFFYECSSLKTVTIPKSVTEIGESCFFFCNSLSDVTLPERLTTIGNKAFYCASLKQITIPGRTVSIGDIAFSTNTTIYGYENTYAQQYAKKRGCRFVSLGEMEFIGFKYDISDLVSGADEIIGCWGVPRGALTLTTDNDEGFSPVGVGLGAFRGYDGITAISIEPGIEYINGGAFADCTNLKDISISSSVNRIGVNAFNNTGAYNDINNWQDHIFYLEDCLIVGKNISSTSVIVKSGTRLIADEAFSKCTTLKSISIPDSVTSIGRWAFQGYCKSLESINVSDDNQVYSSLDGVLFTKSRNELICYPQGKTETKYIIPDCVTKIGEGAFSDCSSTSIIIPDSVTSIGNSAFNGCTSLTSISIPNGVTSIGNSLFEGCSSLKTLFLPQSIDWIADDAFENCNELNNVTVVYNPDFDYSAIADKVTEVRFNEATSIVTSDMISGFTNLKKVEILDGVTEISNKAFYNNKTVEEIVVSGDCIKIGNSAFENCDSLRKVIINNGVQYIGENAFKNCKTVEEIVVSGDCITIGNSAFENCDSLRKVIINNGVQYIGENAFKNCKKISDVFLPDSITVIGSNAFSDCTALKNITLSNNLTEIKDGAFMGCAFTSITIPNKVTKIGDNAFFNCGSLKSITLPDSVESIGEWSFADCDSLTTFTAGDGLTVIGPSSFSGCAKLAKVVTGSGLLTVEESAFFQCSALSDVQLGDNVQDIWYWAFGECTSLEYIELPSQLSFLGKRAFSDCTSLKSIIIPDGVSQINEMTFYGCTSLKKVVFGKYTNAIGKAAFCDCSNLTSIRFPVRCNSIGDLAFGNCSKLSNISFSNVTNVSVGKFAFSGCPRLTNVYLPCPDNGGDNILLNGCFGYSSSGSKLNINIYGYNNSEAQTYAKSNGFKFYSLDYPDVASNAWFYNAVKYCTVRRDITGYKNGNFGPSDNLKRQDFVVILARIAGADLSKYENVTSKMPDVVKGSYYAAAVNWAVDNKIISGYQNGKFGVGDNITREQVCTILYRYMGSPQVTNVEKTLKSFNDSGKISSFSKDAIAWAIQNKVISGKNATTLAPTATASRAEIATIIMRMDENFMFYGYIY